MSRSVARLAAAGIERALFRNAFPLESLVLRGRNTLRSPIRHTSSEPSLLQVTGLQTVRLVLLHHRFGGFFEAGGANVFHDALGHRAAYRGAHIFDVALRHWLADGVAGLAAVLLADLLANLMAFRVAVLFVHRLADGVAALFPAGLRDLLADRVVAVVVDRLIDRLLAGLLTPLSSQS